MNDMTTTAALSPVLRDGIDRYEAGTLPTARLWVTFLRDGRPVDESAVQGFSVYANGKLTPDPPEVQTAKDLARPMAVAVVLDARYRTRWEASRSAIKLALSEVPEDSIAFAVATHEDTTRLPAEGAIATRNFFSAYFITLVSGLMTAPEAPEQWLAELEVALRVQIEGLR